MKGSKVLVVLSGGLDSSTLLHWLKAQGATVAAVTFDYGQRHDREIGAAFRVSDRVALWHRVIDLRAAAWVMRGSALTGSLEVPSGHYEDESMKATVVPNRNMILIALSVAAAQASGFDSVAFGAHAGDHAIYPDCREEFANAMAEAVALATAWAPVKLIRPFVTLTKADIVRKGAELGVPFDLTWSCYRGEDVHCGTCGTCVERREAFQLAGVPDPTGYAT